MAVAVVCLQEDRLLAGAVQQFGENWVLVAFSLNKYPILRGRMRYVNFFFFGIVVLCRNTRQQRVGVWSSLSDFAAKFSSC